MSQEYENDAHKNHGQVVVHLAATAAATAAVGVAAIPRLTYHGMGRGALWRINAATAAASAAASAESLWQQDRFPGLLAMVAHDGRPSDSFPAAAVVGALHRRFVRLHLGPHPLAADGAQILPYTSASFPTRPRRCQNPSLRRLSHLVIP